MEKNKPEYRFFDLEEWKDFLSGGVKHNDKIAILELPRGQTVLLKNVPFYKIELCGETTAIIDTQDQEQIVLKDRAIAVVLRGNVLAKGMSCVYLFGRSSGELTNRAEVYAFGETQIELGQASVGWLFDEAKATLKNNAIAYIGEYASASAEGTGKIYDMKTTGLIATIDEEGTSVKKAGVLLNNKYKRIGKRGRQKLLWARDKIKG